ncbi:O-antigen ligase family protein [Pseudomonas knackmussii]|uniref:O-antigen ligase family protein n=1 Tax=Pseudomonas knackmussii TaxID=65741 RepID=UPI003F4A1874
MWQGIFPHKNALGNFSALSFSIFIGLALIQKRKSAFIGCTLSAILVIMSNSSTSMFAMLATFFAYIALSTPALRKSLTQSRKLYITALFTISSLLVLIALSGDKLNIFDKDTSFSQRDLIWARVLLKSIESPIFGFGLDQFQSIFIYKSTDLAYITGSAVSHAHNGFIEAFFYLGIIGLLAAINLLFTLLGKDRPRDEQKANILFLTTFIIINSFEAQFLSFNPYIVILFLFIRPSGNINSASRAKLCPT